MCSVIESLHNFYFEKGGRDNVELGRRISSFKSKMLLKAAKDIEESDLQHHHVLFHELTENPKAVVQQIYKNFGWDYSSEYDEILDRYLAKNAKDRDEVKRRKSKNDVLHAYDPETYGLTAEELSSGRFREYIEKFNIPTTSP